MCKFCNLTTLNKETGEKSNECNRIARLRDGSQTFNVYLNRYMVEAENIKSSSLELDIEVATYNGHFTVKESRIHIKYCPFCGKEL